MCICLRVSMRVCVRERACGVYMCICLRVCVQGSKRATSTVTGLIDGVGSVGAAIQGVLMGKGARV
jgi:hypothetical protein